MKFHHIGIAVNDLNKTIQIYDNLGYTSSKIIHDKIQNVNISFLNKKNSPTIELVSPIDSTSPVYNILKKNGVSPYHTCYSVKSIKKTIKNLRDLKFIKINDPVKAIAFNDRLICFLFNKDFGLIELLNEN